MMERRLLQQEQLTREQGQRVAELERQVQESKQQSRSLSPRVSGASLFPLAKTGTSSSTAASTSSIRLPMAITPPPARRSAASALKKCLVM